MVCLLEEISYSFIAFGYFRRNENLQDFRYNWEKIGNLIFANEKEQILFFQCLKLENCCFHSNVWRDLLAPTQTQMKTAEMCSWHTYGPVKFG